MTALMPGEADWSLRPSDRLTTGYRKHSVFPDPVPVEISVARPSAISRTARSW